MTASVKLGIAMLLALGLVAAITGDGWAGGPSFFVQIDDLTDTITLTLSQPVPGGPLPPNPTILPGSVGEFLHFTLPLPTTPISSLVQAKDFAEGPPGVLSDRLLITQTRFISVLDVQFASDPATLTLPPGVVSGLPLLESGTFQFVAVVSNGATEYDFFVRSDASSERGDVPAPATLLLLGSGLAALAGAARRRRRK